MVMQTFLNDLTGYIWTWARYYIHVYI